MNTEKMSVNVNIVDLGKIDLLIDKGLYNNRTDFFNTAISTELSKNELITQQYIGKYQFDIGFIKYSKEQLEALAIKNIKIDINVIGRLCISPDVSLELSVKTINKIRVFGVFKAPDDIRNHYKTQ